MSRKWTNVRFEFNGRRDAPIVEASADPRTKEEAVFDYLSERWDDENVAPMETIDVMFGNPSVEKLERWMNGIFENCQWVERAGVVGVTDSAHIGFGWVFERDGDGCEIIDEYDGYEGAMGNDVAGMIAEDYGIRVCPDWYWD